MKWTAMIEGRAKRARLAMEYDPRPPFSGGTPASADPELIARLRVENTKFRREREKAARRAAAASRVDREDVPRR